MAIEPRLPQAAFPEHHHDFHEIVIVEHGTGIHVFNGQPYTISGGTVCFVRDHDRHLLRHSDHSVTEIAYRCGFGDSNHFSTLFRREFNWSPRDIRQGRDAIIQ